METWWLHHHICANNDDADVQKTSVYAELKTTSFSMSQVSCLWNVQTVLTAEYNVGFMKLFSVLIREVFNKLDHQLNMLLCFWKFWWNIILSICLYIICDCFCATIQHWSHDRYHMTQKTQTIYYLALHREKFAKHSGGWARWIQKLFANSSLFKSSYLV